MFDTRATSPQTESTPFRPANPYGIAKLFAHESVVHYREVRGLFACCGILFNHESPLRGPGFVTRKVCRAAARIGRGAPERLTLGNLDACRDWGYAPEYVRAMWLMLQQQEPEDFVIASGRTHSVRELVTEAFATATIPIEWRDSGVNEQAVDARTGATVVDVSPDLYRPADGNRLCGNAGRAARRLTWRPATHLEDLVRIMVGAEQRRLDAADSRSPG